MGRFMQYLPSLCLCWVITGRARLRPHLPGQVPTQEPEIWVCTKPAALHCCQEMWQARIPQHPAWNAIHPLLGSSFARRCIPDVVSPNNTSKNHPCERAISPTHLPDLGFFGLLECREQPLTPACAPMQCGCTMGAGTHTEQAPKGMMLQPVHPETSPTQDATTWLSQQQHKGGPCCTLWPG